MKKKYLGILAGLLLLAGCSSDETFKDQPTGDEGLKTFTSFTATLDDMAGTRAFLGDADETGNNKRVFFEGDEWIWVYSDTQHEPIVYYPDELKDNNRLSFSGDKISGHKFYALFPQWSWEVDEQNPDLARFYFMNDPSFDDWDYEFYAPMVAVSTDNHFVFKQVMGAIHISIGNMVEIESAIIRGNNGEMLGGDGYVDLSKDQPEFVVDGSGDAFEFAEYWSDWSGNSYINGQVRDIYFYIPPTIFENGFTLEVTGWDSNGNQVRIEKTASAKLDVKAATVVHFAMVDVGAALESQAAAAEVQTRAALKAFYDALDGKHWNNDTNWNTDAPLSEWYGIIADDYGNVTGINLEDNNLSGEVPGEIGQLSTLRYLNLNNNYITSLPEEISQLQLSELYMYSNQLSSLPESLGNMQSLRDLGMWSNQFTEIPEAVRYLTNLIYLDFDSNQIEGEVPSWLPSLTNLETLYLDNNSFSGPLPEFLAEMTNLRYLYLSNNQFTGEIPLAYFNNLSNLQTLNVQYNNLSGTINRNMQQSPMWQSLRWRIINPQRDGNGINIVGAVTSIEVNRTEVTLMVGEEFQFEVTGVYPAEADNGDYYWDIDDYYSRYISLDETGKVTALAEGEAWIYVRASDNNGAFTQCHINVVSSISTGNVESFTGGDEEDKWVK